MINSLEKRHHKIEVNRTKLNTLAFCHPFTQQVRPPLPTILLLFLTHGLFRLMLSSHPNVLNSKIRYLTLAQDMQGEM